MLNTVHTAAICCDQSTVTTEPQPDMTVIGPLLTAVVNKNPAGHHAAPALGEGGVERAGHTEWVNDARTQARGSRASGPPDPSRAAERRSLDRETSLLTRSLPRWTLQMICIKDPLCGTSRKKPPEARCHFKGQRERGICCVLVHKEFLYKQVM